MLRNQKWRNADFEDATCFRCRIKGNLLYNRGPFGIVSCPECNQVFISPRLTKNAEEKLYQDANYFNKQIYGYSNKFKFVMFKQKIWMNSRINLITKLLKGNIIGKQLLEIGSAYGFFLGLAKKRGFKITGIEISDIAVKWAQKHLGLNLLCGTIETIQLPSAFFDVVCFWDVIEHVEDPLKFLKFVNEVTKKNGVILFSCPYFDSVPQHLLKSRWNSFPEQHLWQFTTDTIKKICSDTNIKIQTIIKSPFRLVNLTRTDSIVAIGYK